MRKIHIEGIPDEILYAKFNPKYSAGRIELMEEAKRMANKKKNIFQIWDALTDFGKLAVLAVVSLVLYGIMAVFL